MSITFSGLEELDERLANATKQSKVKRNQAVKQMGELLLGRAKDNTPVDTGNLRKNWHRTRPLNGVVKVGNSADYAAHVEYGHRTKSGNPVKGSKMLHLALMQTGKHFKEDAAAVWETLFK